jgi:hypothetical protein
MVKAHIVHGSIPSEAREPYHLPVIQGWRETSECMLVMQNGGFVFVRKIRGQEFSAE